MKTQSSVTSLRSLPTITRGRWSRLLGEMRRKRHTSRLRDAEVMERMQRLERDRRRSGAYEPEVEPRRRWS